MWRTRAKVNNHIVRWHKLLVSRTAMRGSSRVSEVLPLIVVIEGLECIICKCACQSAIVLKLWAFEICGCTEVGAAVGAHVGSIVGDRLGACVGWCTGLLRGGRRLPVAAHAPCRAATGVVDRLIGDRSRTQLLAGCPFAFCFSSRLLNRTPPVRFRPVGGVRRVCGRVWS